MYATDDEKWVCTHGVALDDNCQKCDKENGKGILDRLERKWDNIDMRYVGVRLGVAVGVTVIVLVILMLL